VSRDVDLDRLADFVGGALDGTPDAADVRHLIATDERWAESYEVLVAADATMRMELGALGAPEDAADPMPPDVVSRLDRAIRDVPAIHAVPDLPADTRVDTPAGASVSSPARRTVVGFDRERRRPARMALAAAAAILVCGAGSIFAMPYLSGGSSDSGQSTAGAGLADRSDPRQPAPAGGAVSGLDAGGFAVAAVPVVASGSDYRPDTLASIPRFALSADASQPASSSDSGKVPNAATSREYGPSRPAPLNPADVPAELGRLLVPAALQACVRAIVAGYGGQAMVADYARFQGRPALTVLLAGASVGGAVAGGTAAGGTAASTLAVVVGAACGSSGTATDELYHAVV
jgi:hypothetical protein